MAILFKKTEVCTNFCFHVRKIWLRKQQLFIVGKNKAHTYFVWAKHGLTDR